MCARENGRATSVKRSTRQELEHGEYGSKFGPEIPILIETAMRASNFGVIEFNPTDEILIFKSSE